MRPNRTTNVDLHFWGVDYFELPSFLHGVEIATPTKEEVDRVGAILKEMVPPEKVVVIFSENQRFFVVADSFKITENEWDIFESPIEFRSHFRAK
jgi:hypothetical protein